ncbi:MAG: membrane protein [Alphaproteobacteria bacterium]|nr:MAG: membrane protein [Alphaproteobacteria bacterium]
MRRYSAARPGRADHDPRRGRWYPWLFVAAFAVVIAVNGVMVTLAVDSFAGLDTEHPYERGLAYNETLAAERAQDALGWTVAFDAVPAGAAEGGARTVEVTGAFQDRAGAPLTGLSVRALLRRPAAAGHDREVALAPQGPGRYSATAELPFPGQWELRIVASGEHDGSAQSWQSTRRILLP